MFQRRKHIQARWALRRALNRQVAAAKAFETARVLSHKYALKGQIRRRTLTITNARALQELHETILQLEREYSYWLGKRGA